MKNANILMAVASMAFAGCATTSTGGQLSSPPCPAPATAHAADAVMRDLIQAGFRGAVVVTKSGMPVYCASAGEAFEGKEFDVALPVDVGSIAKPVTALAIHTLVQNGRLSLDDPIRRWFPDSPADKAAITVRQLLLHTSGLGEYIAGVEDYTRISEDEFVRRVFAQPLGSAPGAKFAYSNTAYSLLALIVGRASGRSFFDYVETAVFRPAGISASFDPADFQAVAEGQTQAGWTVLRNSAAASAGPFWGLWGAGGVYMSARDLAQLIDAFVSGKIVSPETARSLRQPAVQLDERNAGGLAWGLARENGGGWDYYFNGASDHSSADIRHNPDTGLTIAVVSNSKRPNALRAGRALAWLAAETARPSGEMEVK